MNQTLVKTNFGGPVIYQMFKNFPWYIILFHLVTMQNPCGRCYEP